MGTYFSSLSYFCAIQLNYKLNLGFSESACMFDEEEQKMLEQTLAKTRKDYQQNCNVYDVSAFDPKFDQELEKLVIYYSFDFQAIALHLFYKFPQYSHRLKPQAVCYRWYQLVLEREGESIKKQLQSHSKSQKNSQNNKTSDMQAQSQDLEDNNEEIIFLDPKYKQLQYQQAMLKAQELDEEETQSFMLYKPKFIIDSQFKLERSSADQGLENISALIQNEIFCEFGPFDFHQAPLIVESEEEDKNEAQFPNLTDKNLQSKKEADYLEDDWQAYQSD